MLAFLAEVDPASGKHREDAIRFTSHNVKAMIMPIRDSELRRLQRELADVVGLDRTVDDSDLDKLPFLKCVVKEALRMHPPIPVLLHEAAKDCVVGGYSVPRGSRVLVNAWAINRDCDAWKDADTFRPSRFMPGEGEAAGLDLKGGCYEFVPFGSGRRSCPAQGLGQHAVELAVAQLAHAGSAGSCPTA
ncbi:hypothetical protein ACQ4PT_052503 [Festuca glaucescens]